MISILTIATTTTMAAPIAECHGLRLSQKYVRLGPLRPLQVLPAILASYLMAAAACGIILRPSASDYNILTMAAAQAATTTPSSFQNSFLLPHNQARASVGVGPLRWDEALAGYAQSYAQQDAGQRQCQLVHSGGPYGENLFWGSGRTYGGRDAVAAWVAESSSYDYGSNACAPNAECGHYTQVVWRGSTAVGCAVQPCPDGRSTFITCNYSPPGNYVGQRPY